jgi:hypothetical protein
MNNMKQLKQLLRLAFLSVVVSIFLNACKKEDDEMIPPKLEFKTGAGYISSDATVPPDTTVTIGIHAEQTESEDYLNTFTFSHSFDGGDDVSEPTETLDESEHEIFEEDIQITTRDMPGTEKYTFTITNRDGLIVSKSITLTVQ